MDVTVRLFATLRERAGTDRVELELRGGATAADALAELRGLEGLGPAIAMMPVVLAVNRDYAGPDTPLNDGDELALIPPVSGGDVVCARVTEDPLSLDGLAARVGRPEAGAIVTFQGVTREVEALDYEAYVEMAERRIDAILRDCLSGHGALSAGAEHRIGRVELGEPSVIVAVSAAHREAAFAAARTAIDRIKSEAPIWKAELRAGTSSWVEGTPPPAAPEGGAAAAGGRRA